MEEKKYELVRFKNNEVELEVSINPLEETVWLTQKQMAYLYGVSVDNISLHIKNIFKEYELDNSVVEESSITAKDGKKYKTKLYNLDMIISVGYRIKSKQGIIFRKWANNILKEYLLRGYVINENRTLVTNENYIELINKVNSINNRVLSIENELIYKDKKTKKIFNSGEVYDANSLLQQ